MYAYCALDLQPSNPTMAPQPRLSASQLAPGTPPMRLDDPDRPFAAPGVKALLLDGGAVPYLTCLPLSPTITRVIAGLRNYDCGAAYSYSYEAIKVANDDLPALLSAYFLDPEATLKAHWGWEPQPIRRSTTLPRYSTLPPKTPPMSDIASQADLL